MMKTKGTLIYISGISGSGKTTVAQKLDLIIDNSIVIDQDSYFARNKPLVKLSSGETVINYDSEEAIRWDHFNEAIAINLQSYNVIVTGFALRSHKMRLTPNVHFLLINDVLVEGKHNIDSLIKTCYTERQNNKRFYGMESEKFVVPELVVPFYFQTLSCLSGSVTIVNTIVQKGNNIERLSIDILIGFLLTKLPKHIY